MTTTTVQTYAGTPALAVSLPPADRLPESVRAIVQKFNDAKQAALACEADLAALGWPERDDAAVSADHALLAEGKAPVNVARLERDRATANAKAIDARRSLHFVWFDQCKPTLAAAKAELVAHAAAAALVAGDRFNAAMAALPAQRAGWCEALFLLDTLDRCDRADYGPTWDGSDQGRSGSVQIGGRIVFAADNGQNTITPADVAAIADTLRALAEPTDTDG